MDFTKKLHLRTFFSKIVEKNAFLKYYCHLFREVCFCMCPLIFIQTSKGVLIIGTMHMCVCANNYWKCVNSKCLRIIKPLYASAYILKFSRKRNKIKWNIYDGVRFTVLANCWMQLYWKKNLLQTFPNKSFKIDYQWSITITYFARFQKWHGALRDIFIGKPNPPIP